MSQSQIIFGFHPIISQLRQSSRSIQEIYLDSDRNDPRAKEIVELAKENNIRILMVDRARLDGIASQAKHQGVVAKIIPLVIPYKTVEDILEGDLKEPAFFLILDGVEDPHNLGACLRVADGMGVHAVIAPKDRAVGLNSTVRKVASGAAESVPFIVVTNLARTIRQLKEQGVLVVGTAEDGVESLYQSTLSGPIAVVLGSEGSGLRRLTRDVCDLLVKIPMLGAVESLNVSVASGIVLSEIRRQRFKS
jgi:23S rRNA (guanosine2251-2'-O)-methyltransferase